MEQSNAKLNKRRKGGGDLLPTLAASVAPQQFARLSHPLHAKMALVRSEPVQYKSSEARILFKKKGEASKITNWRSILLGNIVPKTHHKYMRNRLMETIFTGFLACQCGGMKGRSTDEATLFVRGLLQIAQEAKSSILVLYVDITAAFYTVIRQLVFPGGADPETMQEIVRDAEIPAELIPVVNLSLIHI